MARKKKTLIKIIILILSLSFILAGCTQKENDGTQAEGFGSDYTQTEAGDGNATQQEALGVKTQWDYDVPDYSGEASIIINNNIPFFDESMYTTTSYETYGELDRLGRCTCCIACLGIDLMPTGEREDISHIKPTGWVNSKYDFIEYENLYNRSHLLAYQLTGENANERNLITGTRYFNAQAMLPYEEEVGNYVRMTNNHVLYRVTPLFEGDNLVAKGVLMEAYSVEDDGVGICFNVFVYNVQPGVIIDYATGENHLDEAADIEALYAEKEVDMSEVTYILNSYSGKFHMPDCPSVDDMKEYNKVYFYGSRDEVIAKGYEPCGKCKP